jgi:hypothetical protein
LDRSGGNWLHSVETSTAIDKCGLVIPAGERSGSPAGHDRWRAYLDTDDELVFYCPE